MPDIRAIVVLTCHSTGLEVLTRACEEICLAWGHGHQDIMEGVTIEMPIQDTRDKIRLLEAGRAVGYICRTWGAVGMLTPNVTTLD